MPSLVRCLLQQQLLGPVDGVSHHHNSCLPGGLLGLLEARNVGPLWALSAGWPSYFHSGDNCDYAEDEVVVCLCAYAGADCMNRGASMMFVWDQTCRRRIYHFQHVDGPIIRSKACNDVCTAFKRSYWACTSLT